MDIEQIWPQWKREKKIGKGSYGTVYKCSCEIDGKIEYSAIKVISVPGDDVEYMSTGSLEKMSKDESQAYYKGIVDDFINEVKILDELKGHKNIVRIDEYTVVENTDNFGWQIFIRMELLTDFNSYSCDKTFNSKDVIKLADDLGEALKACAEKNIIHRDIKPENIFVDDYGNFKLGDFGVAKQMERTETAMSRKGTYNYMAPEILQAKKGDSRADIYSLGIVMYQLLNNNRLPFVDPEKQFISHSERQKAFERRTIDGEKIPKLSGISDELNTVILTATQFRKEDRYKNAQEFSKAIGALSENKKLPRKKTDSSKKKSIYVLASLIVLIVAVGLGFGLKTYFTPKTQEEPPVTYDITYTGIVDGVYTHNDKDYFATGNGFFVNDGTDIKQLTDQQCVSQFNIIKDKIYYTVFEYEDAMASNSKDEDIHWAQCSGWVMNIDGSDNQKLFDFNGNGCVLAVENDKIYYVENDNIQSKVSGFGKTLSVYSLTNKATTVIQKDIDNATLVNDAYLIFNRYSGDAKGTQTYNYSIDSEKLTLLKDLKVCSIKDSKQISYLSDNTVLMFVNDNSSDNDAENSKLISYDVESLEIASINDENLSGSFLNVLADGSIGICINGKGNYIYDGKSLELVNEEASKYAFVIDNKTIVYLPSDEVHLAQNYTLCKYDGEKSAYSKTDFPGTDICLSSHMLMYKDFEVKDNIKYDNCDILSSFVKYEELDWKDNSRTFLVSAGTAMLDEPIAATIFTANGVSVRMRYGPDKDKYDVVKVLQCDTEILRLTDAVDNWYFCEFDESVRGWIFAPLVKDKLVDEANEEGEETSNTSEEDENNLGTTDTYDVLSDIEYKVKNNKAVITGFNNRFSGELVIPGNIKGFEVSTIGEDAFVGCNSLTKVVIPEGVIAIETSAFEDCISLKSVVLPSSLVTIRSRSFCNCSSLEKIDIPSSVTNIEMEAFKNCISLNTFKVPKNVTNIDFYVFDGCVGLNQITVDKNNRFYTTDKNGVLFDIDKTKLIYFPANSSLETYTIPSTVEIIGESAFNSNQNLKEVILPNSLKEIGYGAFDHCKTLETISVPDSVSYIGAYAFNHCDKLRNVTLPDNLAVIEEYTFYGCSDIDIISLPKNIKKINSYAFANCKRLNEQVLGEKISFVGKNAFTNCKMPSITVLNAECNIESQEDFTVNIIYGYDGSSAQKFASNSGIEFKTV